MALKKKNMNGGDETSQIPKETIMQILKKLEKSMNESKNNNERKLKIESFKKFIDKFKTNSVLQEHDIQNLILKISNKAENSISERIQRFTSLNNQEKKRNYNKILKKLEDEYIHTNEYNSPKLIRLANIGSSYESIIRMANSNNKQILLKALIETIKQSENSLGNYKEFQEYKRKIIPTH